MGVFSFCFVLRENRRLPAGAISAEEKELTGRVRAQRKAFAAGRLCSYQVRRLLCIPGFSFQPLEDRWQANYEEYRRFTVIHWAAPRLRSPDKSERRLAGWAAKARMAFRAGTLPQSRIESLDRLEFWSWGPPLRHRP